MRARILGYLDERGGVARMRDIVEATGGHTMALRRMVAAGDIAAPIRGVYALPECVDEFRSSYAFVMARVPEAVMCLLSAASWHGLVTREPLDIWMALPRDKRDPVPPDGVSLRPVRWRGLFQETGVESVAMYGVPIRMTTPERTVCDLLRFRGRPEIGEECAVEALTALVDRTQDVSALEAVAQDLGCLDEIAPYVAVVKQTAFRY